MAFMNPPEDKTNAEDLTELANVAVLEEDGDVESENTEYGGVVSLVETAFRRSKEHRMSDETRWLMAYRNYRGLYGPEVQFTSTEKSKAFVKITKTKVLAAYAQIVDVLFAGNKFPVGIEPRKSPANVAGEVNYDPNQITDKKVQEKADVEYKVRRKYTRPAIEKDLGVYKDITEPVHDELNSGPGTSPSAI